MTRVIVILGATATGKTEFGMRLAEALGGEIVNGDALQVYRGFDLGTAKPTRAQQARIRHHLIDVLAPEERYCAGGFVRRARQAIEEISARGKRPIVIGGSGLYLRSLVDGLSPIPHVPDTIRVAVAARLDREGLAALFVELGERDPETAARLAPGDRQRVTRALEVLEATGRPLSAWHRHPPVEPPLRVIRLGLTLPRAILYDRVARRVRGMVKDGWVEEVRDLLGRGVNPAAAAFQAIGYRQIALHVLGSCSLEEAVEHTIRATRRYAKRQFTWFRRERDVEWLDAQTITHSLEMLVERLSVRRKLV